MAGSGTGAVVEQDVPAADEVVRAVRATHPDLVIGVGGRQSSEVTNGRVVRFPDRLTDAVEVLRQALD